jgi:hypothetical protein
MVGYALAAGYPGRISKWVAIDAPLPGVGHWAEDAASASIDATVRAARTTWSPC